MQTHTLPGCAHRAVWISAFLSPLFLLTDAGAQEAPVIAPIGVKGNPHVGTPLVFGAAFTDIDARDKHLGLWSWGDGSKAPASVHGKHGAGSIEGRHAYREPGIYTVRLTVLDSGGKRAAATRQLVVRAGASAAAGASAFHRPAHAPGSAAGIADAASFVSTVEAGKKAGQPH